MFRRYFVPGVLVSLVIAGALLWPRNGDAGVATPALTMVYTGDVVGKIEPCG